MMVEYTMVRLDILVKLDYLVKFDYNFTRYLDPIMVYSFAMWIRVNLGDHMCFCNYGLGIIDINKTSRGHGITLVIIENLTMNKCDQCKFATLSIALLREHM